MRSVNWTPPDKNNIETMKYLVLSLLQIALLFVTCNTTNASWDVSEVEVDSALPLMVTDLPSVNGTWSATSRVIIHIPDAHHNEAGELHVSANFGPISRKKYRGILGAFVKYVDDPLCQPLYITEAHENKTIDVLPLAQAKLHAPFWLMVNRGNCSFVKKARMAQEMGASGVIFADDKCLCSDATCNTANESTACQTSNPPVNDNGSGGDVSIPAFLLQKKSADSIKEGLGKGVMYLEYKWGLPDSTIMSDTNHQHVSFDLWSTASPLDVPLLEMHTYKDLKTMALKFADYLKFTPRYALIDGVSLGCAGEGNGSPFCQDLCTNNGRYCSVSPRDGIKGKDVVLESLRRICIWKHYGVNDQTKKTDNPILWDYIIFHIEHCTRVDDKDGSNFYSDNDCLTDAFKHAKIDNALINECIQDSGGYQEDRANTWLEEEVKLQQSYGVVSAPTITINKHYNLDELRASSLFDVMCAMYLYAAHETTMTDADALKHVPELCTKCFSCPNKVGCVENDGKCVAMEFHTRYEEEAASGEKGETPKKKKHKSKFWVFFLLTSSVVIGGTLYYKKNQERFASNRGGILNGYFSLNQGE